MILHSRLFGFIRGYLFGGLLAAVTTWAAVDGVVWNGTTGREQAGVAITLVKLEQGMMPVASARSDAAGKFHFAQNIVGADTKYTFSVAQNPTQPPRPRSRPGLPFATSKQHRRA